MNARLTPAWALRPMRYGDLSEVMAIERAVYDFPWSEGNFRDALAAGYSCWVAEEGGTLLAYAVMMVALDEAHLLNIAVAPGWQRRGLGRRLADHMLALARAHGARTAFLEVRPSNLPARRFYDVLGFDEIATRRHYYPARDGREDAIVMAKAL